MICEEFVDEEEMQKQEQLLQLNVEIGVVEGVAITILI